MKLTKLLVLGALWLVGLGAQAADLIERTAPQAPSWTIDLAAIDKTPCEFEVGEVYVLYNVGAELYYYRGNAWGSQASGAAEAAIPVRFVLPEGKTLADKQLYLRDFDDRSGQTKWRTAFITTGDSKVNGVFGDKTPAIFIDSNDGTGALMWVEASGEKTYRISISESNTTAKPEGLFWGIDSEGPAVDGGVAGTCIMPKKATGTNTEWQLFAAPAEMSAYFKANDIYQAAESLKKQIEKAEAAGVDVAAAVAAYNNESATKAQLEAEIEALKDAINSGINSGTAENPADATTLINNPNFDNQSSQGWGGDAPGYGGDDNQRKAWVAEHYNKTFDTNQELSGLPAGVYGLKANTFFRGTWEDYKENKNQDCYPWMYVTTTEDTYKTLFNNAWAAKNFKSMATNNTSWGGESKEANHNDEESGLLYYIPDNPSAFRLYQEEGFYKTTVVFDVTDGKAKIGVKKDKKEGGSDWAIFDTFSLIYYGNTAASYAKACEDALKAKYNTPAIYPSTAQYKDAVNTAIEATVAAANITTMAEANAFMAEARPEVEAARDTLIANMALWKEWEDQAKEAENAMETYFNLDDESVLALMEYADATEGEIAGIRENRNLTNDELRAEVAKVKKLIADVVEAAKNVVEVGDDMTKYLTNPNFSEGQKGWTGWNTVASQKWNDSQTKNMPTVNESCAEAFCAPNFDLYQEVEGLPLGIYEVNVQGFFRFGRGDDAWNEWNKTGEERSDFVQVDDPAKGSPVFFYVNEKATPFINVYQEDGRPGDSPLFDDLDTPENEGRTALTKTETDGVVTGVDNCQRVTDSEGNYLFFPDGMKSAHNYFNAGAYKQTTFSAVAHKGDKLRIGVKGYSNVGVSATNLDSWAIFDNFKLVYKGTDKAVVKPVLVDAIEIAKAKQNLAIAKDVKEELAVAVEAAETAVANDVDDMFSVLANLWGVDVSGSQQRIQNLKSALTPFENAINSADEAGDDLRPRQSVIDEAAKVRDMAQKYVGGETEFTNADIDAILEQMEELTEALKVPEAMEKASDDNEANAIYLITNPTYDDNSSDRTLPNGWKQEGTDAGNYRANSGVYEVWNPHVDVLSYQDLEKMPAGTYKLSVQGVYRYGWAENEYKAYTEDANANNNGALYVKVAENEAVTKALPRLATLAEAYEAEYKTNEDGEPVLNNGEKQYDAKEAWVWAQKTVSEDESTASGYITPDQLKTLTPFFEDETVQPTSIIFKVNEGEKVRIGVNIKHAVDGDWVVWDNWTLTYYGPNSTKDPDVVDGVKDASALAHVVKTEVFNLSGAKVKNGKGIAIVRQTLSNGTVRVKKVIVE